jgi:6-phosphogluconolactonase
MARRVPDETMRLEVYPSDAETFEASAELAARQLRETAGAGRVHVALPGGRDGRAVMTALAARSEVPWERIEWFWADERCVPPTDPASNVGAARRSLLEPRGIPATHVHPPPIELGDPALIASAYAATVGAVPAFDLVLLVLGTDGHVAALAPGSAALGASVTVAPVSATELGEEPRVARITVTPPVLHAARRVIVTAVGAACAGALAAAVREPAPIERLPARLVRPSTRVTWIIDRAAARELLRDARPAGSDDIQ